MSSALTTRRDFREAGRTFAIEVCAAMSAEIERASITAPASLTDEFVNGLTAKMMEILDGVTNAQLDAGAPMACALKFRTAFLLSASYRLRDLSIAASRPAGRA